MTNCIPFGNLVGLLVTNPTPWKEVGSPTTPGQRNDWFGVRSGPTKIAPPTNAMARIEPKPKGNTNWALQHRYSVTHRLNAISFLILRMLRTITEIGRASCRERV